ncbi:MAG: 30S ribosomal protein S8 [Candidatus Hydrogenedens sp.]|nr:30S ribosomal protein S8 [Candidatus Hydrogenedens sp.]
MSLNDPIADLLTRVRNATRVGHATVDIPASNVKVEMCRVLKDEGFIEDFIVSTDPAPGLIRVTLKYRGDRSPVIQGIKRVSRPSLRVYVSHSDIAPVRSGLGISIMTTSKGVMTGRHARQERIGGEVLCEVW